MTKALQLDLENETLNLSPVEYHHSYKRASGTSVLFQHQTGQGRKKFMPAYCKQNLSFMTEDDSDCPGHDLLNLGVRFFSSLTNGWHFPKYQSG